MGALCSGTSGGTAIPGAVRLLPALEPATNGCNGADATAAGQPVEGHEWKGDPAAHTADGSLRRDNADLRVQLTASESKASLLAQGLELAQEHATAERVRLQHDLDQALSKMQLLKSQNQQLTRRVSDMTTGHHEEPSHEVAANDKNGRVLLAIRAANPNSKLPVMWRSADFRRWEGVRMEGENVTGLALSGLQLTILPEEIGELTALSALILSNNGLSQLPRSIGKLRLLTCLLLDNNALTQLPDEVTNLTMLNSLWLQDNQLSSLPAALGRLTNVRQMLCNANQLTSLPASLKDMCSLSSLWLDSNKLSLLPAGLANITTLRRLRVDPSLLDALPPELTRVTAREAGSAGGSGALTYSAAGSTSSK